LEVALTSGGIEKLEKYKRFQIAEVWFWQNDRLVIYGWRGEDYERISSSELLPNLDVELLNRCVLMSDLLEARAELLRSAIGDRGNES
jgi:Uma2 family endonuclease